MRYDDSYGWLLSKDDFLSAGFSIFDYNNGKNRGQIITTGRACRGKKSEIVFSKLSHKLKSVIEQRFECLNEERTRLMLDAKMSGMDMTEIAIKQTARLLEINAPYIQKELKAYIDKHYGHYTRHYLELGYNLSNKSIIGYAKLCAVSMWLYSTYTKLSAEYQDEKSFNRVLRSLRVNFLTAIETFDLEVKLPSNDIRFSEWLDRLILNLSKGIEVTEIVTVKRAGNTNAEVFTQEMKQAVDFLWISGSGMSAREAWRKLNELCDYQSWKKVGYTTVANYIEDRENILMGARTDYINAYNNFYASISREWPTKKNYAWGVDGTGHNENVFLKGKSRQHLSVIKLFDYATMRNLHNEPTVGFTETAEIVITAIKNAIKNAGYKPYILQMDQGPAYNGVKDWCNGVGITVLPTGKGRARAKVVELMIGQFDDMVTRYLRGFSGMNLTAQGRNSKPSEQQELEGKRFARSAEMASQWLRTEGMEEWNQHIIETIAKQKINKTPNELWNSLESETPKMSLMELAKLVGQKHTKKLENEGLEIKEDGISYMYFPPIETEEQQLKAAEIFTKIPRGKDEGSQLDIYILDYGKPAPVFRKNTFIGYWTLKQKAKMFASFEHDTEVYDKMKKVPELQNKISREAVANIKSGINRSDYGDLLKEIAHQPLTGRKRTTGRYDKEECNIQEFNYKAGVADAEEELNDGFREYVDPDSGEIYRIKKT